MWWRRRLIVSLALSLALNGVAYAVSLGDPSSSSSSFRLDESQIGAMGDFDSSSASFQFDPSADDGGSTLGEAATGNSSSASFQSGAGFNTTNSPALTMMVNTTSVNLGTQTTAAAQTGTATFWVKNYTSYGYVVQVVGAAPTYAGNALDPITTSSCGDAWGCASSPGSEQFGLNLVANTSPVSVGADPVQDPELPAYSFGEAGDGTGTAGPGGTRPYAVPGRYRFVSGETVARAPKTSGKTTYTVTFLTNISNTTAAGAYQGNLSIVVTGTY